MIELYHFCSKKHIESIRSSGLLFGKIPVLSSKDNLKGFIQPAQWLTSNKSFNQSWCEYSTLPYNRNDYRITIVFNPENNKLKKWSEFCQARELKHSRKTLNSFGDPENWYVLLGVIKPGHFKDIIINPELESTF